MKLNSVLKILRDNSLAIKRLGVTSLAIFGSTARNEASQFSDVDILATFIQPPTFDQYIETKILLEDLLNCKVDLVTQDGLKPLVRAEIEKESVYAT